MAQYYHDSFISEHRAFVSLSFISMILLKWNVVKPEMDLKIPVLLVVSDELPF